MLTPYRRHGKKCPHRRKGQNYFKCKCPIWAYGEGLDGKPVRESLKTRDWQRALKRIATKDNPFAPKPKAIKDAIAEFDKSCWNLADSTKRKYGNITRHVQTFCEGKGIEDLAELTVEIVSDYIAWRGINPLTASKELQTLRQFCSFCVDRKWIAENVAKRVKPPKNLKPSQVEPYTLSEIGAMLSACHEFGRTGYERSRARAMLLLLCHTALRISDIATLRRDRIRKKQMFLHTKKTGGQVNLPVPPDLQQALDSLPLPRGAALDCPYFFWNGIGSRRAVVGIAERTLAAVFSKSKVPGAKAHRFRHTLATTILADGGTEQDVADILGISPAIVRKHYAKWSPARQERITKLMEALYARTNRVQIQSDAVN